MKPLGRKYYLGDCKWKPKEKGKHLRGWWEGIIPPSKARFKREVKKEIENEKLRSETCS